MEELQDEWQENVTVNTPSSARNSQNQSQYFSGNWSNTYHRDQTTPGNRRRTDHGANSFMNANPEMDGGAKKERLKKMPIIKDFYIEDPSVRNMSRKIVSNWHKKFDVQIKRDCPVLKPIPNPVFTFEQAFNVYPRILSEIQKQGLEQPTPFQSQAWPVILRGEDMIGIGQPGTGKLLSFILPALIHINGQPISSKYKKEPCVLILAPTRGIAQIIYKEVKKYGHKDTKAVCLYAEADREKKIQTISKGVDIVIATPGQLYDFDLAHHIYITNFSYIVLNEVDKMVYMDLKNPIMVSLSKTRPDRQMIMTSATWPPGAQSLAKKFMQNPTQVNVGSSNVFAAHRVTQEVLVVEDECKGRFLLNFLRSIGKNEKVLIICNKCLTVHNIKKIFIKKGIGHQWLCENDSRIRRETAIEQFVDGIVHVLLAAVHIYGCLDLHVVSHVVNYDFPGKIEEYVRRLDMTGRAGIQGTAFTLFTEDDRAHASNLIKILQKANQKVPSALERMARRLAAIKMQRGGGRGHGQGRGRNHGPKY